MNRKIIVFVTILAAASFPAQADSLTDMKSGYSKELKKQSDVVIKSQKWQSKKVLNEEQSRDLMIEKLWLQSRIDQYEKYIKTVEDNITELKRKKVEITRVSEELEPLLDETVMNLDAFIKGDMPFLNSERHLRMDFLKRSLSDYKVSAGEKLRRILEALQIEAEYGKNIEVTTSDINLNGDTVTVDVARFGRLGLYYLTPDRKSFGYYSHKSGGWQTLDNDHKSELIKAFEIADRKRVMDVIYLPVSAKEVGNAE